MTDGFGIGAWASLAIAIGTFLATPAMAATLHRSIHDMSFGASPVTVHAGDVIEWTNNDFVAHTVTARDGAFDVTIQPGKTERTTLAKSGKVTFFCRFHPTMTGTIDVAP